MLLALVRYQNVLGRYGLQVVPRQTSDDCVVLVDEQLSVGFDVLLEVMVGAQPEFPHLLNRDFVEDSAHNFFGIGVVVVNSISSINVEVL